VDAEAIRELFASFGPITVRRMFGGAGVFADGIMIALVADGVIYLKADEVTVPGFQAEGLGPFTYQARNDKRSVMSYWRMPDRLYDDPDELAGWPVTRSEPRSAPPRGNPNRRPRPNPNPIGSCLRRDADVHDGSRVRGLTAVNSHCGDAV
jgi:DNA transformation protein and related proteins